MSIYNFEDMPIHTFEDMPGHRLVYRDVIRSAAGGDKILELWFRSNMGPYQMYVTEQPVHVRYAMGPAFETKEAGRKYYISSIKGHVHVPGNEYSVFRPGEYSGPPVPLPEPEPEPPTGLERLLAMSDDELRRARRLRTEK